MRALARTAPVVAARAAMPANAIYNFPYANHEILRNSVCAGDGDDIVVRRRQNYNRGDERCQGRKRGHGYAERSEAWGEDQAEPEESAGRRTRRARASDCEM